MPFGTRRRIRRSFQFIDPILPLRVNEGLKLKEISKQGLENTSQREEPRPSAKAPIKLTIDRDIGKGINRPTPIINKAEPSVANPDAPHPTAQDKKAIFDIIPPHLLSSPPKLSSVEDKLLARLEKGDASLTDKELEIIGNLQKKVNKAPTRQAEVDSVKKDIKKSGKKIKSLTSKGLRAQVEKEIKLKEQQLSKLRALLSKCPTCK